MLNLVEGASQEKPAQILELEAITQGLISHLYAAYNRNGGDPAVHTVFYLLQQIHRISPYLSDVLQLLDKIVINPSDVEIVKQKLQPIIEIVKQGAQPNVVEPHPR